MVWGRLSRISESWQKQFSRRYTHHSQLKGVLHRVEDVNETVYEKFSIAVTPYMAKLMDRNDPLGVSQFVQDVRFRRGLEGELSQSIQSLDAIEMARWRRRPQPGQTVVHSDRGSQYTAWTFDQRLRSAGLLGSMGRVASALDNAMMESFFGTLQMELLDRKTWGTRAELGRAIFEWIEGWYNPRRRHTSIGDLSPVDYERRPTADTDAA